MTFTTNTSELRQKLGTPKGEYEITHPNVSNAQQDEERMNENTPVIDEIPLGGNREYIVDAPKSTDKKLIHRNKLRREPGKEMREFTKKSGA
jgi:hypothetical protein